MNACASSWAWESTVAGTQWEWDRADCGLSEGEEESRVYTAALLSNSAASAANCAEPLFAQGPWTNRLFPEMILTYQKPGISSL
jgi:hypothetical protein